MTIRLEILGLTTLLNESDYFYGHILDSLLKSITIKIFEENVLSLKKKIQLFKKRNISRRFVATSWQVLFFKIRNSVSIRNTTVEFEC